MNIKLIRPQAKYARQIMSYKEEMLKNGDILTGCACLEDCLLYTSPSPRD